MRILRTLLLAAAGAILAFAQIVPSANPEVNKVAEQINATNSRYLKQKYGATTADPESMARRLQETVICAPMTSPEDGEVLTFIVPVSTDEALQKTWLPKVLAECRKYPLAAIGVHVITVESGLSMAPHRHLLVHLPGLETELGWTN